VPRRRRSGGILVGQQYIGDNLRLRLSFVNRFGVLRCRVLPCPWRCHIYPSGGATFVHCWRGTTCKKFILEP